jgi:hypothetical protein
MPIQEGGRFSPEQNIVSPGVFTRENDLSGLAQGVANIGGAIVAPFSDGPAFFPARMTEVAMLEQRFGVADGVYYGPYTAKEYLIQQGVVTVVRIGGLTGYWQKNPLVVYAEPGYWNRNSDLGALTTSSFMYLDSDNYTSNLILEYSSSTLASSVSGAVLGIVGTSGTISSSVTVTRATNTEVEQFLVSVGWPDSSNSSTLSASLAASGSKGKLFKIATTRNSYIFSASVVQQGLKVQPSGGSSEYTLANFDYDKSLIAGVVSASIGSTKYSLTYSSSYLASARSYYNYLTSSYTLSGNDVTYGLVFGKLASNNAIDFSNANISSSKSTAAFVYRYDTSRLRLNGVVNGKFAPKAATSNYPSGYNGTGGSLSGSVLYAGKQVNLGTVTTTNSSGANTYLYRKITGITPTSGLFAGYYYLTSSVQSQNVSPEVKIATAFNESSETVAYLSASMTSSAKVSLDYDTTTFDVNGTLSLYSASFKSIRSSTSCGSSLQFLGLVGGAYGDFNGTFTSQDNSGGDPCNPNTSARTKMVLAVLNNTQNGSTQFNNRYEVFGFDTSTLSQLTSSVFPYKGLINPNENTYQLILKYNFANDDGTTSAGTYGYYDFTLNESDNNYIANVFGFDPTAGNPAKQVAGQKVEAAYNYLLFNDSIQRFIAEKTRPSAEGGGWKLYAKTAPETGFAVGEPLKFVDQYSTNLNAGDSQFGITNAYTPWIYSQKIAPFKGSADAASTPTKFQLFKVHTLSDGTLSNKKYKIEISNVKLAGTVPGSDWGSFTLAVRAYSDTDKRPKYLEIYQNLNLNPESANFVARRIGDRYAYITFAGKIIEFGTYTNLSQYIRIEMADGLYPEVSVPYGFESYSTPVAGTLADIIPPVRYSKASIWSLAPGKYASGTVFNDVPQADDELVSLYPTSSANVGVYNDTYQYFKPLPSSVNGINIDFDLEDKTWGTDSAKFYANGTGSLLSPTLSGSIPSNYDPVNESTYVKLRKFLVGFQGGFEGQWPAIPINIGSDITAGNTQGLDCTNINSPGSIAYKQAIAALGNADEFDINLIVLPGIFCEQHSYVTDITIDMCEARGDCFYIMDNIVFPASNQTVGLIDAAVNSVATIDSNYVGTYYPWVKILDTNTNKVISVPPSVVLPAVYAANDNAAAEWYAPAGLNRGGIPTAVQVLDRLTHSERDTLYEGRVNPIAAFPGQGICVWGQKTLQIAPSALDRINVRRLLINLKKFVASSSNYLVFEQNVASTRNRFLSIVNPYLESVQQRNGIYAYQVKMDEQNNTPDLIDRNILYGQIFIQPTRTAEFIILDFNILPTGASFNI